MTDTQSTRRIWNDTALGQCGRYHEAMASGQRFAAKLLTGIARELTERDAAMHERWATACYEAQ